MLVIGNKKFRNLQEQVGYNTEQIDEILKVLDGINVHDNVVVIPDISETLTPDELEIVKKPIAFLVYNDEVYIKKSQDSTNAYFDKVFTIDSSTNINFETSEIEVNLTTGVLGITNSTVSTYSTTQVDNKLDEKADLTGADFTGSVTATRFSQSSPNWSHDLIIASAGGLQTEQIFSKIEVINNVLYIVVNAKITNPTASSITGYQFASSDNFTVPATYANKIYDLLNQPVSDAIASDTLICAVVGEVKSGATPGTVSANISVNFVNKQNANKVIIELRSATGFTIPAGESRYVTGRMFLLLI